MEKTFSIFKQKCVNDTAAKTRVIKTMQIALAKQTKSLKVLSDGRREEKRREVVLEQTVIQA